MSKENNVVKMLKEYLENDSITLVYVPYFNRYQLLIEYREFCFYRLLKKELFEHNETEIVDIIIDCYKKELIKFYFKEL